MSWRDRLQQGSFRGVPFRTRSNDTQVGRRKAIYELPFDSSGVASIDLGRRARRYTIDAIIIGEDYDQTVKKLIEALEAAGPGLLVHPTLGISTMVEVEVGSIHVDTRAGGKAEIRFEAVESRAVTPSPTAVPDQASRVTSSTAKLRQVNVDAFVEAVETKGQPDFVGLSALAQLDQITRNLQDVNAAIGAVLSVPGRYATAIDRLSVQAAQLLDSPKVLLAEIEAANLRVFGAVNRVAGRLGIDVDARARQYLVSAADEPLTADPTILALRSARVAAKSTNLTSGAPQPGTRDTPARQQERANSAAISLAARISALAALIDAANQLEVPNKQAATSLRDILVQELNAVIDLTEDAAVYDALETTKAAVRQRFSGKGLTEITSYTPFETIPADLIAWNLYGDVDRADEIVQRNGIAHPGAVPAHMVLEVLSE